MQGQTISPQQQSLLSQQVSSDTRTQQNQNQSVQFELTPLEQLLKKVGGQGKYQFWSWMIFNAMWFLTSWTLMGMGFFFDDKYQCFNIDDQEQCSNYICSLNQADRPAAIKWHANSIVFAFQNQYFICENAYLKPILVSLIYLGSLLGFFVIPYIADNWGRKVAMRISWGICAVGILFIGIADSPHMVGIGQLFTGFGCNPAITLCYSFLNEQVLGSKRQYYGVIIQVVLAFGECTIAVVFLPDYGWEVVCYILFVLVVAVWVSMSYLVQSPKFLISKSKKKTLQVLNQIAKKNGNQPLQYSQIEAIAAIDDEKVQGTSVVDLLKYGSLRWPAIGGGFVFLAIQVIYYTTLLNLDNIGYTKFVNQQIVGLSQAFGYIAAEIVISRILRKKWSLIGMFLSSLMCFVLALLTIFGGEQVQFTMKIAQTISLITGRFVLCAVWALFYIYIAELYPTKVRSMGLGFVSGMGTVGSTLAPYMLYYSTKSGINQWILPGILGIIGFMFIFSLRETFKMPLQDDIEEVRIKGHWDLSDEDQEKNQRKTSAQN